MALDHKQQNAIDAFIDPDSIEIDIHFITGFGGCGKTHTLKQLMQELKDKHGWDLRMSATTHLAAKDIEGVTFYSLLGLGILNKPLTELLALVDSKPYVRAKFKAAFTSNVCIVVDEISLLDADKFEKLVRIFEHVAPSVGTNAKQQTEKKLPKSSTTKKRKYTDPKATVSNVADNGGDTKKDGYQSRIRLLLSGDFLQLPPVKSKMFAFEAPSWKRCVKKTTYLRTNYRQNQGDRMFFDLTSRVRMGRQTPEDIETLSKRNDVEFADGIKPTLLCSRRDEVALQNGIHLDLVASDFVFEYKSNTAYCKILPPIGPAIAYSKTPEGRRKMIEKSQIGNLDHVLGDPDIIANRYTKENLDRHVADLESKTRMDQECRLKIGAQVLICENIDPLKGLINGARATVVGFYHATTKEEYRTEKELQKQFSTFEVKSVGMFANSGGGFNLGAPNLNIPQIKNGAPIKSGFNLGASASNTTIKSGFNLGTPAKSEFSLTTPVKSGFNLGVPVKSGFSLTTPVKSEFNLGAPVKTEFSLATPVKSEFNLGAPAMKREFNVVAPSVANMPENKIPIPEKVKSNPKRIFNDLSNPSQCFFPIIKLQDSEKEIYMDPFYVEDNVSDVLPLRKTKISGNKSTKIFLRQLPLLLAYALTIHKVQGMTLKYVKADCRNLFEDGMFYVILSRVRSLDHISFINFTSRCILTSSKAVEFYEELEKNSS